MLIFSHLVMCIYIYIYIRNELDDILICGLLCFYNGKLSTCNKQDFEVEECSGALKFCYK